MRPIAFRVRDGKHEPIFSMNVDLNEELSTAQNGRRRILFRKNLIETRIQTGLMPERRIRERAHRAVLV